MSFGAKQYPVTPYKTNIPRLEKKYRALCAQFVRETGAYHAALRTALVQAPQEQNWGVAELTDEVIVVYERCSAGNEKTAVQIGFPFPLDGQPLPAADNIAGYVTRWCLRGHRVRRLQRDEIMSRSDLQFKTCPPDNFRAAAARLIAAAGRIIYVDPYNFLGDSYMGIYNADIISDVFHIRDVKIFTPAFEKHMKGLVKQAAPLSLSALRDTIRKDDLIILPDYLDPHWDNTVRFIEELGPLARAFMVPGRNLLLDGAAQTLYWTGQKDVFLHNSNIETMMHDALRPYLPAENRCPPHMRPKIPCDWRAPIQKALLNPFSSQEARDFPPELVAGFIDFLAQRGATEIFISKGVAGVAKDQALATACEKVAAEKKHVRFIQFEGLAHIGAFIAENAVDTVITPDTSVPHMANYIGARNLTVFMPAAWDFSSAQCLANFSPLGFCRFTATQLPLLAAGDKSINFAALGAMLDVLAHRSGDRETALNPLSEGIEHLLQDAPAPRADMLQNLYAEIIDLHELQALDALFPCRDIIEKIRQHKIQQPHKLVAAAYLASPVYKFGLLNTSTARS